MSDQAHRFRRAADGFAARIAAAPAGRWDSPSPCPGWTAGDVEALPEDVLIHTWDLARATDGDDRLDPDLVAHVYAHLRPMDEALRQPWAFGPKVTPPPGADLQTEFLCFAGRRP